jgi:TonB family protein
MSIVEAVTPLEATLYAHRKHQYPMVVWLALAVSVGFHWAAFRFFPTIRTAVDDYGARELKVVEIAPPAVEIPPAPGRIVRPGAPVISEVPISEQITIAATTFEDFTPMVLPPPPPPPIPEAKPEVWANEPTFTPYTTAPVLQNPDEAARVILENYPRAMREAGVGGTVTMWFFLDETGKVRRTLIATTSGYEALDQAASDVAETLTFTPAYNRDTPVKVWVQLPIMFTVRR